MQERFAVRPHASRASQIAREIVIVLLFAALAVAMTWPLALNLPTASSDPGDPYIVAWLLHWDWQAITHHPLSLFDAPIFYPAVKTLAFSEHIVGIALFGFPLFAAGLGALTVLNILMIAGFALSGYAAYILGRLVTGSTSAAIVGGIFYAFVPFRFNHMPHLQHVWSPWLPLLIAALVIYERLPRWRSAILAGAVFFMNGLSNMHWLLFGSLAIALSALLVASLRGRVLDLRWWMPLGTCTGVATLLLLPFLLPYREVSKLYGVVRSFAETEYYSAHWSDWLVVTPFNRLYQSLTDGSIDGEHLLFPGLGVLFLTLAGFFLARRGDFDCGEGPETGASHWLARRWGWLLHVVDAAVLLSFALAVLGTSDREVRLGIGSLRLIRFTGWATVLMIGVTLLVLRLWWRFPLVMGGEHGRSLKQMIQGSRFPASVWVAIVWVILGLFGSLGLNGFFHTFLFEHLEPFRGLRVPARWAMIAYTGLALLAATGAHALFERLRTRWSSRVVHVCAATVLSGLLLLELRAAPIRWYLAPSATPALYTWLATANIDGAILELPAGVGGLEHEYMWRSTVHGKPLINGASGFTPPDYVKLQEWLQTDPIPSDTLAWLERIGCSLVVVHSDSLGGSDDRTRRWLRESVSSGRLVFVRHFDRDLRGDWVFALTKVEPNALSLRAPETPDPSGRTPLENSRAWLEENAYIYNASAFGMIDQPVSGAWTGPVATVYGWAMAPSGVETVRLRFATGTEVVSTERFDRPDVREALPWYPRMSKAGFRGSIELARLGIDRVVDVQVEIVDGEGNVTRLRPRSFRWTRGFLDPTLWKNAPLGALLERNDMDPVHHGREVLASSMSIWDIADSIVRRAAKATDEEFVDHAFHVLLGRPPDEAAVKTYGRMLEKKTPRGRILELIITSEEFVRTNLQPGSTVPLRGE